MPSSRPSISRPQIRVFPSPAVEDLQPGHYPGSPQSSNKKTGTQGDTSAFQEGSGPGPFNVLDEARPSIGLNVSSPVDG